MALSTFKALFESTGTIDGELEGIRYRKEFERMGGTNVLESLQYESNKEIYMMAYSIAEMFSEQDEEE